MRSSDSERNYQRGSALTGNTKTFPGFDHLYYMQQAPMGNKCFYADLADDTPEYELLRGEWTPEGPLCANWGMGTPEPEDIARGRTVTWFYLSPRVQEIFRNHHLTGWSTYPLALRNKAGEICPGYKGLSITGRCGPIDENKGALAPGESPDDCFAERVGIFFDESSWDGADFFYPTDGVRTLAFRRNLQVHILL
ncbi:hypothetical protein Pan181_23930 [Aeoliella mucimassa]|uniref:Uncharacterized protein n=1 Tax=Aeoliella mucimassa TaxID=2527972 RepID=A0A518AN85_9BACT|nr:hypothetical protein Pan181_23930 [Aeoliella mucimassa]